MSATTTRALYRLLLLACPADVRREDGPEMEEVFLRCVEVERGRRGWLARRFIWMRAVRDTVGFAVQTRIDARRREAWPHGPAPRRSLKERMIEMWRTFVHDVRFGSRLLVKDRTFAATVLITLAICIGANAAIFSIVRSVLLKPLPVPNADRLVMVYNSYPNAGAPIGSSGVPDYFDRVRDMTAVENLALFRREGMTLGSETGAERLTSVRATPSFYRLVQARPVLGRVFTDDEGEDGKNHEVILSYGTWKGRFGGDAGIVGQQIRLSGVPYEVVGVLPSGFKFLWNDIDLWTPAAFTAEQKSDDARHSNSWNSVGMLKPGATIAQAQEQLDAINSRNDERFPEFHQILKDAGFTTKVVNLQAQVVRDIRPVLYLLWAGVLFVLLIGCVNIANLVVVRANGRSRELATRNALGAGVGRLTRQLLTETMILASAGGALGILLGWWLLRSIPALHLDQLPRGHEIGLDPTSVAVTFGLALAVGLVVGLVPVVRLSRLNVSTALREESRSGTGSRGATLLRRALATAQVAIAFVLLVGAGLMLASFEAVLRINPGFSPSNVVTAALSLPSASYKDRPAYVSFVERTLAAVRALPGVESAGVTSQLPFGGDHNDSVILAEGYVMKPGESLISPTNTSASPGYFEAMRIPLVRGRYFDARDTADAPKTIIIDERLAEKFWAGRDPIGRRMYSPDNAKDLLAMGPDTKFVTVVGVVGNVQMEGPGGQFKPVGAYYYPYAQVPTSGFGLVARTGTDPVSFIADVRKQIAQIDRELPVYDLKTMDARMDEGLISRRVPMLIAIAFGAVALFLAALGIYGVLAYGVAQRRREIGIRMALGSTTREVFSLVLGDGVRMIVAGFALGLVAAYFAGRAMTSILFGVQPMDPRVVLGVIGLLAVVALVATIVPARRAARVNPLIALSEQ
jgi:putative ABC transport system permease protein